jgi:hypothetical protein
MIRVHIEELVLHGFAPADRERIARAVQAELATRLLASGVSPALAGAPIDRIDAGAVRVAEPAAAGAPVGAVLANVLGGRP